MNPTARISVRIEPATFTETDASHSDGNDASTEITFTILAEPGPETEDEMMEYEGDGEETEIGVVEAEMVHLLGYRSLHNVTNLLDELDCDNFAHAAHLFCFGRADKLLIIRSISISPEYRGRYAATRALRIIQSRFGGRRTVILADPDDDFHSVGMDGSGTGAWGGPGEWKDQEQDDFNKRMASSIFLTSVGFAMFYAYNWNECPMHYDPDMSSKPWEKKTEPADEWIETATSNKRTA